MAKAIVDLLEIVQVDVEQCKAGRAALTANDHALELIF